MYLYNISLNINFNLNISNYYNNLIPNKAICNKICCRRVLMQLTEFQKWEKLRELIVIKNKEFGSVISSAVGRGNKNMIGLCMSRIRDDFLSGCGTSFDIVMKKRAKKGDNWIDVLSTQDLLLYYDYQCRALSKLYGFVWSGSNKRFNGNNLLDVIDSLEPNFYAESDILDLTGAPKKTEEKDLFIDLFDAKREILSQSMLDLHKKYCRTHCISSKISSVELASRFRTFVAVGKSIFGVQGCEGKLKELLGESRIIEKQVTQVTQAKSGEQFTILSNCYGEEFTDAVVDNEKISSEAIQEDLDNGEYDDELVGFDINGTPIVRRGDKLYNSLGEVVDDNIYITEDDYEL